jgi:hypothetical protein
MAATKRRRRMPIELMVYRVICMTLYAKISLHAAPRCALDGCARLRLKLPRREIAPEKFKQVCAGY